MIAGVMETLMLICFGVSWPFNILKSWRSRTAKGKSLLFELCVFIGYLFGITGKFVSGHVNCIVVVYIIDILMVGIDLFLTMRNRRYDRRRETI